MDRDSKLRLFRKSLYAPHWLRVARDGLADQLARPPANRVGSHSHEILLNSSLESYSCRGRVAQLGEHLLCKQGVAGSIPATSTNLFSDCKAFTRFISAPISQLWSRGVNP